MEQYLNLLFQLKLKTKIMTKNWVKICDTVLYKLDIINHVAIIKISREEHLNALNKEVITGLEKALNLIEKEKKIRSAIITGEGLKAFVAGADIKEFEELKTTEANRLSKTGKDKLFNKIAKFNKPILAAINGYALGGGLELALSCHIRVASRTAKLGLPECTLGLIPGYGGTQRFPRIVGMGHAMEMILTGKMINSEEAHRIGLVNYVTNSEDLIQKCMTVTKLFNKTSPDSLQAAIKSINSCRMSEGDSIETLEFSRLFDTANFQEGVSAFLEKRLPNFNK